MSYLSHRGAQALAVSIIFTCLATSFVAARLYTRIKLMKRMEANDWMIVTALVSTLYQSTVYPVYHKTNLTEQVFSFVFMGLFIVEAVNGMGMHGAAIPTHILVKQMKVRHLTSISPTSSSRPTNGHDSRHSGPQSQSTTPPSSVQKPQSSCNISASSQHTVCVSSAGQ